MIDEEATFEMFGYRSTDLKKKSSRPIVAVCDDCGRVRILKMDDYRDLCHKCAMKSKKVRAKIVESQNRPEVKAKKREAIKKLWEDSNIRAKYAEASLISQNRPEVKAKKRESAKKMWEDPDVKAKRIEALLVAQNRPEVKAKRAKAKKKEWENKTPDDRMEFNILISCGIQGIPRDEFDGFASNEYCNKFNESCREHNREKYDRKCFLCGELESENGRKLDVHHIDGNKDQGCNGHDWKLTPLCMSCHGMTKGKRNLDLWHARIMYLHKHVWKRDMKETDWHN